MVFANAGFGLDSVLPFWFGESHRVTPAFIRDVAGAAVACDETCYTHNLAAASLREALADYLSPRHGPTRGAQIAITGYAGRMRAAGGSGEAGWQLDLERLLAVADAGCLRAFLRAAGGRGQGRAGSKPA